jgi:proteasome lid subunit RPN8/RPN11
MIKRLIEVEAEKKPNEEVCGFVVEQDNEFKLVTAENRSQNKEQEFYIPARDFLYIKSKHNIVAVYHSHPQGGDQPSDFDKTTADLICYPFVIYSVEKNIFGFYEPEHSDANSEHWKKLKEELND